MKKNLLSIVLLFSLLPAFGQYKGGLEVGGNFMAAAEFNLQGMAIDTKPSWGIRLGYAATYHMNDKLFLRGAALINQRGFSYADERWGLSIIDVPLNLGLELPLGDSGKKWFFDAGINFEYNFRAFTRFDGDLVVLTIGNDPDDIKPFSMGYNLGTGLRFGEKFDVRVNYYRGLVNLLQTGSDTWQNYTVGTALIFYI